MATGGIPALSQTPRTLRGGHLARVALRQQQHEAHQKLETDRDQDQCVCPNYSLEI